MFLTIFRVLVLFIVITYSTAAVVSNLKDFKVELVQVLFRHGDRIIDPEEVYPKDPYKSMYESYGYGQLTNKGKKREYQIGKMLRQRYGEFLGEYYKSENVYAYSTDQDRTKMSLQLVLAGIYSPTFKDAWNDKIHWIPIPTHYNSRKYDFLSVSEQCPEFGELFDQVVESQEMQRKLRAHKGFIEYLSNNTGLPMLPSIAIWLYHSLRSQRSLDLPLPSWCTEEMFNEMEEITALRFDIHTYTNALKKLSAGPTIRRFLRNIKDNDMHKKTEKLYLYSAHDNNVAPFLRAHNFTTPRTPDYGSAVIMEKLRGKDDLVYIRFLVWSGIEEKLTVLKLNNCNEICSLSDYIKIIDPALPSGEGTECLYKNAIANVKNLISDRISNEPINSRLLKYVAY